MSIKFDILYDDESDYAGMTFGSWTVLGPSSEYTKNCDGRDNERYWWCKCRCGEVSSVCLRTLLSGRSSRCNKCRLKSMHEGNRRPNSLCKHPLYSTWDAMMAKCYVESNMYYPKNGGRGITVYPEWHELEKFILYVERNLGKQPDGGRIHRINTDEGYYPGNIEWRKHDCTAHWVKEYEEGMVAIFSRAKEQHSHLSLSETWATIDSTLPYTVSTFGNTNMPVAEHNGRGYINIEGDSLLLYRVVYAVFTNQRIARLGNILHLNDNPNDNRIWNLIEGTTLENTHMRSYNRERITNQGGLHLWWLSTAERTLLLPVNL